jgi:hypothetical protein
MIGWVAAGAVSSVKSFGSTTSSVVAGPVADEKSSPV